jgi:hypothetical protein
MYMPAFSGELILGGAAVSGGSDRWIRWTTTGCVALLALIAGTVSYLHMHLLVELHGQPGWVAALTPFSVDGMIVAASTTLLADSRSGGRGGFLPWALLVVGSVASLAANVAVAEPTTAGRMIAAWPSFALIAAYELLMRQVRQSGTASGRQQHPKPGPQIRGPERRVGTGQRQCRPPSGPRRNSERSGGQAGASRDLRLQAWQWALANRAADGSLPSGREVALQYGRHERWGRLVKRSGAAGELAIDSDDIRTAAHHRGGAEDVPAHKAAALDRDHGAIGLASR